MQLQGRIYGDTRAFFNIFLRVWFCAWPYLALLSITLWHTSPIWLLPNGYWYHSHEMERYVLLLQFFSETFKQGIWYPRWLPQLMGGYGYPTFIFYQPLFFFLGTLWSFLFENPILLARVTVSSVVFLGGLGAYQLSRYILGDQKVFPLLLAFAFIAAPYNNFNLFIRGDLSEYMGSVLCLWTVYAWIKLLDAFDKAEAWNLLLRAILAVLAMTGVAYAHPFVALFSALLFLTIGVGGCFACKQRKAWLILFLTVSICAVALSSPYWLHAFMMKQYVTYQHATQGAYNPIIYLLPVRAIIMDFRVYSRDFDMTPRATIIILSIIGWIVGAPKHRSFFVVPLYIFYLSLMTSLSRGLWETASPVLGFVQFPWRVLSVTLVIEFMGMVYLSKKLLSIRFHPVAICRATFLVLAIFCVVHIPPYARPLYWLRYGFESMQWQTKIFSPYLATYGLYQESYADAVQNIERNMESLSAGEFNPLTMHVDNLPHRLVAQMPWVMKSPISQSEDYDITQEPDSTDWHIKSNISLRNQKNKRATVPVSVVINQFDFPGWAISVNGRTVLPIEEIPQGRRGKAVSWQLDQYGRMEIVFPKAGNYMIQAYYEGPPYWCARNLVIIFISIFGIASVLTIRKSPINSFINSALIKISDSLGA